MNKHKITLNKNTRLLHALREHNHTIKSSCNGQGSCGDCVVKVLAGMSALNRPTFSETKLLGNVFHITKERLSCQCSLLPEGPDSIELDVEF